MLATWSTSTSKYAIIILWVRKTRRSNLQVHHHMLSSSWISKTNRRDVIILCHLVIWTYRTPCYHIIILWVGQPNSENMQRRHMRSLTTIRPTGASQNLCSPNEDFGMIDKRGNPDFRWIFQGREFLIHVHVSKLAHISALTPYSTAFLKWGLKLRNLLLSSLLFSTAGTHALW